MRERIGLDLSLSKVSGDFRISKNETDLRDSEDRIN